MGLNWLSMEINNKADDSSGNNTCKKVKLNITANDENFALAA